MQRPEGADLRKKVERPTKDLENLYAQEKKHSGYKTINLMSLIAVEKYIIYIEKKLKQMEVRDEQTKRSTVHSVDAGKD